MIETFLAQKFGHHWRRACGDTPFNHAHLAQPSRLQNASSALRVQARLLYRMAPRGHSAHVDKAAWPALVRRGSTSSFVRIASVFSSGDTLVRCTMGLSIAADASIPPSRGVAKSYDDIGVVFREDEPNERAGVDRLPRCVLASVPIGTSVSVVLLYSSQI